MKALAEAAADYSRRIWRLIEEKYVTSFSVAATQVALVICGPWCLVLSPIILQDVAKEYPNWTISANTSSLVQ